MSEHLLLQRMKQAQLASAFDGWVAFGRDSAKRRSVMRACAARLRNRVLAAAFAAWTSAAAQWASKRDAAAVALRHWELSAAAAAFATWHDEAAEQHGTIAAASHCRHRVLWAAFEAMRCDATVCRYNCSACANMSRSSRGVGPRLLLLQMLPCSLEPKARSLRRSGLLTCTLPQHWQSRTGASHDRRFRARKLTSLRAAATMWRLQAMAQAFRRWQLDTQNWRHVKHTLSCIAGETAKGLVSTDFDRCAALYFTISQRCPGNFVLMSATGSCEI